MKPETQRPRWLCFTIECSICGQCWVGVAPVGAIQAECPSCGYFNEMPGALRYAEKAAEAEDE